MQGYTVGDLAARWRVGEDKVRGWIKAGTLKALDVSGPMSSRTQYVVTPEQMAEFEAARAAKPTGPKRRRRKDEIDFYP